MSAFPDGQPVQEHMPKQKGTTGQATVSFSLAITASLCWTSYSCYGIYGHAQLVSDDEPIRWDI